MSQHAYLQPSSAHRWMRCPGSVALSHGAPDRETPASRRGTLGHAILAATLRGRPEEVRKLAEAGAADVDLIRGVQDVVAWVRFYQTAKDAVLRIETHCAVGAAFGCPDDLWGTADIVGVTLDELLVADAKFGYVPVEVEDNAQVSLYAIGVANQYQWRHSRYVLAILQPGSDPPMKVEVLTKADLLDRYERYKPLVAEALKPIAPLVATAPGCEWCPVAGVCPELQERRRVLTQRAFADPKTLPMKDLAEILTGAKLARKALDAAEEYALKALSRGVEIPGWKRVATKAHRQWKDPQAALHMLELLVEPDLLWERSFISPAKAERMLGLPRKTLDEFAPAPQGNPTLVRATDPRPALPPVFADLSGGDTRNN